MNTSGFGDDLRNFNSFIKPYINSEINTCHQREKKDASEKL